MNQGATRGPFFFGSSPICVIEVWAEPGKCGTSLSPFGLILRYLRTGYACGVSKPPFCSPWGIEGSDWACRRPGPNRQTRLRSSVKNRFSGSPCR